MKLEDFAGDWILQNGEWDLERIEFRAKGKKPLVLNHPPLGALVYKLAGYAGLPVPSVEHAITKLLLVDTPEPPTIEDRFYAQATIKGLERLLKQQNKLA